MKSLRSEEKIEDAGTKVRLGQIWQVYGSIWLEKYVDSACLLDTADGQTRDTRAMDLALATSIASMSLGSAMPSRSTTSNADNTIVKPDVATYTPDQALGHLTSIFAQLGAIEAAASPTSGKSILTIQPVGKLTIAGPINNSQMLECVRRTTWKHFAPSIAGLADDKAGRDAFGRAYRCAERARRVVVTASKGDRGSDLFKACRQWLSEASEAIGLAIKHLSLVSVVTGAPNGFRLIRQVDVPDHDGLLACCITSICVLLSLQPNDVDETLIIGPLDRGRTVACLARNADIRADCLRSLAESAYSSAHGLYGHKRYHVGVNVAQRSIDMAQLALNTLEDKSRLQTSRSWQDCLMRKFVKYDMLGACLAGADRREVSDQKG